MYRHSTHSLVSQHLKKQRQLRATRFAKAAPSSRRLRYYPKDSFNYWLAPLKARAPRLSVRRRVRRRSYRRTRARVHRAVRRPLVQTGLLSAFRRRAALKRRASDPFLPLRRLPYVKTLRGDVKTLYKALSPRQQRLWRLNKGLSKNSRLGQPYSRRLACRGRLFNASAGQKHSLTFFKNTRLFAATSSNVGKRALESLSLLDYSNVWHQLTTNTVGVEVRRQSRPLLWKQSTELLNFVHFYLHLQKTTNSEPIKTQVSTLRQLHKNVSPRSRVTLPALLHTWPKGCVALVPQPSASVQHGGLADISPSSSPVSAWGEGAFNSWVSESSFFLRKSLTSRNALFVLSLIPAYRTRLGFTLSSDKQRSNYYRNLSFYTPKRAQLNNALLGKSYIANVPRILRRSRKLSVTPILQKLRLSVSRFSPKVRKFSSKALLYTPLVVATSLAASVGPSGRLSQRCKKLIRLVPKYSRARSKVYKNSRSRRKKLKRKLRSRVNLDLVGKRKVGNAQKRWVFWKRRTYRRKLRKVSRVLRWKVRRELRYFTRLNRLNRRRKVLLKQVASTSTLISLKRHKLNTGHRTSRANPVPAVLIDSFSRQGDRKTSSITSALTSLRASFTHTLLLLQFLSNPLLLKAAVLESSLSSFPRYLSRLLENNHPNLSLGSTNLNPHITFAHVFTKQVASSFANRRFRLDIIPWYQHTLIRFIEHCTGRKSLFQFYPFVNQHIDKESMVRYRRWIPRLGFYERRLGHRFFLEESMHIMHISFVLRDPKIFASWLKAIIQRISFWRTRSIFRFLKYLFHNYYRHVFPDVKIKGLKIKLKGKISVAGNGRKRTVLYRVGQTSHSQVNLRVVKDFSTINTFTGVMGFQVYLFY